MWAFLAAISFVIALVMHFTGALNAQVNVSLFVIIGLLLAALHLWLGTPGPVPPWRRPAP